jgi:hypothetical protein
VNRNSMARGSYGKDTRLSSVVKMGSNPIRATTLCRCDGMADMRDSKPRAERRAGSSPATGTMQQIITLPLWTGKQYLSVLVVPGPSGRFNDSLTKLVTLGSHN